MGQNSIISPLAIFLWQKLEVGPRSGSYLIVSLPKRSGNLVMQDPNGNPSTPVSIYSNFSSFAVISINF